MISSLTYILKYNFEKQIYYIIFAYKIINIDYIWKILKLNRIGLLIHY